MKCHEFDSRIQQLLDDRQSPVSDSDLTAHALQCAACDAALEAYAVLLPAAAQMHPPALPTDFAQRVVRQVCAERVAAGRPPRAWFRSGWVAAVGAIAALALVAVSLAVWANRGGDEWAGAPATVEPTAESSKQRPPQGLAIATPGRSLGQRSPTVTPPALSGPLSRSPAVEPVAADYQEYRNIFNELAFQLPGAVDRIDAMETYTPGMRPIRGTFSTAFETLWRTLPGQREDRLDDPPQAYLMSGADSVA